MWANVYGEAAAAPTEDGGCDGGLRMERGEDACAWESGVGRLRGRGTVAGSRLRISRLLRLQQAGNETERPNTFCEIKLKFLSRFQASEAHRFKLAPFEVRQTSESLFSFDRSERHHYQVCVMNWMTHYLVYLARERRRAGHAPLCWWLKDIGDGKAARQMQA